MADQFIQVPPQSTGLKLDTSELTVGANTVERERINISDPTTDVGLARVENSTPGASDYGLVTRPILPALPAGSNVIGHVIADSGSTTVVTGNVTAVQATGTNLHVVVDTAPTTAVTNAGLSNLDIALSTRTKPADQQHTIVDSGTLTAVTAITNALPAGTNVLGHVIADTGSTTAVTGNVTAVQATGSNLHVAVDSAPTTAVTNAGLTNLDVALSTRTKPADQQHTIVDSGTLTAVTAITNALPAGSNVIGHVIADSGSTTAVTGNVTVTQATGTNLHAVIDSGSTTAVTGNVTVVQPTGTNLHAVLDSGTTTVTQATGSNLHVVVDTAPTTAVTGTFWQAVQPVSGSLAVSDPAEGLIASTAPNTAIRVAGSDPNLNLRGVSVDLQGQVILSPASGLNDLLYQIILELRANRMALLTLATGGGAVNYSDFATDNFQDQITN